MTRILFERLSKPSAAIAAAVGAAILLCATRPDEPMVERLFESFERVSLPRDTASQPTDSLYRLDISIETARGELTSLAALNGRVRIATMFYTHCSTVCPVTVDTLQRIERALSAEQRERLSLLLLTLDPGRDSRESLSLFESDWGIDDARWLLGRTSPAEARVLADKLGIQYRSNGGGVIAHSSMLVLFDAEGRELARTDKTGAPDPQFVAAVEKALSKDASR